MKRVFLFTLFPLISFAQPCKLVKIGMMPLEVQQLVGPPTEIDTVRLDTIGMKPQVIWQYGRAGEEGNQRVRFQDGLVVEVIADGKQYDMLLRAARDGEISYVELMRRMEKLNSDACE